MTNSFFANSSTYFFTFCHIRHPCLLHPLDALVMKMLTAGIDTNNKYLVKMTRERLRAVLEHLALIGCLCSVSGN